MFAPKNILVPTDFSKYSDKALKQAVEIAKQFGSKIHLLHVIDERIQQCAVDYCLRAEVVKQLENESLRTAKETLRKEAKNLSKLHKVDTYFDIKTGVPSEMILKEQKSENIDLIVMAPHGKTGLLKRLMGSVADSVIKSAKCEVLLVK